MFMSLTEGILIRRAHLALQAHLQTFSEAFGKFEDASGVSQTVDRQEFENLNESMFLPLMMREEPGFSAAKYLVDKQRSETVLRSLPQLKASLSEFQAFCSLFDQGIRWCVCVCVFV